MRVRRLLLVLTLATTTALTAACGSDKATDAKGGSSASAGATAGSTGTAAPTATGGGASGGASGNSGGGTSGGSGNTAEVCKNIVAALDKEKMELATVFVELGTASDDAAKAKAKEHAAQVVDRITKAVKAETAKASDPKMKAAFDELTASLAKIVTVEGVTDPDFENKMDKAMEGAAKYCPALKE